MKRLVPVLVIAFAEDPNFRAYAEGTELLFINAVLLGAGH